MMSPKVYGPRDLREAYRMPREDAVWIMEHCAEVWEKERNDNAALRDAIFDGRLQPAHFEAWAEQEEQKLGYKSELVALLYRLAALASQPEVKP